MIATIIYINTKHKETKEYKSEQLFNEAIKNYKEKRYEDAILNLENIFEYFPNNKTIQENITACYYANNDFKNALKNIESYADTIEEKLFLVEVSYKAKEYQKAVDYIQQLPDFLKKKLQLLQCLVQVFFNLTKMIWLLKHYYKDLRKNAN